MNYNLAHCTATKKSREKERANILTPKNNHSVNVEEVKTHKGL